MLSNVGRCRWLFGQIYTSRCGVWKRLHLARSQGQMPLDAPGKGVMRRAGKLHVGPLQSPAAPPPRLICFPVMPLMLSAAACASLLLVAPLLSWRISWFRWWEMPPFCFDLLSRLSHLTVFFNWPLFALLAVFVFFLASIWRLRAPLGVELLRRFLP